MIIYKATNKINGKSYIGKSVKNTFKSRKHSHERYADGGSQLVFHRALRKYAKGTGGKWTQERRNSELTKKNKK